jgi:aspartyl-tRNA(Asn)/glutamyl-tRNA(Gln) amidotransferase subunit A
LAFGPDECRIVAMEASTSAITDPADLGVLGAAALLRSRELSAVELLTACQRRILERNGGQPSFDGAPGAVNAWIRLYPEAALEQAGAADRRLTREGSAAPLLCGIPLGLKDLFAVEGLPVTASSRVIADHVAARSSTAWRRLAAAGMVLAGHTHTHEFAAGGTTDQVGNPRALDRSAGGSSGGSAAALACGMVPAALGTDTAGSLRIPASLCGVSSMKPTHGLIPLTGIIPLAPSLDHAGPMARSLADCSAVLSALAAGGGEVTPLMPPPGSLGELPLRARPAARPLSGVTIAATGRPEAAGVEPEVALACERALRACERLGARIIELPAVAELPGPDFSAILLSEAAAYHLRPFRPDAGYRTSVREFVEQSQAFTAVDAYLQAQRRRARVTAEWEEWFSAHGVDAILEPTTFATAPLRGSGYDSGQAAGQGDLLIRLTATWNVTGFPVATMPAGLGSRSGLPVGLSLIGPRGAEARVLQIGIDLQAHALPPLAAVQPRLPPAPEARDN